MVKVEGMDEPIIEDKSAEMGISPQTSRELHGFLKDRTDGTANAIVRSNKTGIGLESWRMLAKQFNPRTLVSTMAAQDLETKPRGASKMSEMPARLFEWEKNIRRCIQEGREPPSDHVKRLA